MRSCGILMPLFSLPSEYGIGTLGKKAYEFIDFLKKSGQSVWQLLPVGPTSYGDSPYQSFSSYAGNPYFIDLELLCKDGLLTKAECDAFDFGSDADAVDYEKLYNSRFDILRLACSRFERTEGYEQFCAKNSWWLDDYALFSALKKDNGGKSWIEWDTALVHREHSALTEARIRLKNEIEFEKTVQYLFFEQWSALKKYAKENGIQIMGDLPIYVAFDSADVWSNPEQFELDDDLMPKEVAGCPPDAFSKDGQLWGNPLYDWDYMKNDTPAYSFWINRVSFNLKLYDVLRIDHFRGFESYYAIPAGDDNARFGRWRKGPDVELFDALKNALGELPIVAEDLGLLTEDVRRLLKATGFPGMKVLQFAFDEREENDYLPYNYEKNCIVYTGTHDNDTLVGWLETVSESESKQATDYVRPSESEGFNWAMIRTAYASVADTAIIPMQDFIGADSTARINTPSTLGGNWCWRIADGCCNDWLAKIIKELAKTYGRA